MTFIHNHEAVAVFGVVEVPAPVRTVRPELFVGGKLLEAENLGGQSRLDDPLLPIVDELRRAHDQSVMATTQRVLLNECKADLGLTSANSVCVDSAVVLSEDPSRAFVTVALKRGQRNARYRSE